jgi:hypothetical protein
MTPNDAAKENRSDNANVVFALIAAAVLSGILVHFYPVLPVRFVKLVLYLPLLLGYSGIAAYTAFFTGKGSERRLLLFWLLAGVYLFAVGLLRWQLVTDQSAQSVFINQDVRYFMYAGCGIILSNKCFRPQVLRLLTFIGVLSALFGVIALWNMNLELALLQDRLQLWSLPYYFWWLSGSCFAMNYAWMRMSGRNRLAGLGAFLAYAVCGALFLKKAVIVNAVLLLFLCELLASSRRRSMTRRLVSGALLLGLAAAFIWLLAESVPLLSGLIQSYSARMAQVTSSYDRYLELQNYLRQAGMTELLFGKGFGCYALLPGLYTQGYYLANALHIGYMDIYYVGGIPYSLLWLGILIGILKRLRLRSTMDAFEAACLATSVLLLFSLLFELSRGIVITPVFHFLALGTVLGRKTSESRNETRENLLQRETLL